jgi:flagellar basal-body rod modification protein FlgD
MSISAVNNSALSPLLGANNQTSTTSTTKTTGGLGESDFLNLLITQLKNQDPLNPMKDTEFIAQLASFSSLQQMTSMNTNMSTLLAQQNYTNAANMLGKQVTTADNKTGVVSKVSIEQGQLYLYVGDNKYTLGDITSVSNATA